MTAFVDTNILIDYYAPVPRRYSPEAVRVFAFCKEEDNDGVVSTLSLSTFFYVLRKTLTIQERRADIQNMMEIFTIGAVDVRTVEVALNLNMADYEDAIQAACAQDYYADVIITNDERDFFNSPIRAMTSREFVELYCP